MNLAKNKGSNIVRIIGFSSLALLTFSCISCGTIQAGGKGRVVASKTSHSSKGKIVTSQGAQGSFYFTNLSAQRH